MLRRCRDHEPVGHRDSDCQGNQPLLLRFVLLEEVKLTRLLFQYGTELHQNYQTALKKAAVNSAWTNRCTPSSSNASMPSPTTRGRVFGNPRRCVGAESARLFFFSSLTAKSPSQANGHVPKAPPGAPAPPQVSGGLWHPTVPIIPVALLTSDCFLLRMFILLLLPL